MKMSFLKCGTPCLRIKNIKTAMAKEPATCRPLCKRSSRAQEAALLTSEHGWHTTESTQWRSWVGGRGGFSNHTQHRWGQLRKAVRMLGPRTKL